MDHGAAKETADIYLKSIEENNTAPLLRALASSARNTAQKRDPTKKTNIVGRCFEAETILRKLEEPFCGNGLLKHGNFVFYLFF